MYIASGLESSANQSVAQMVLTILWVVRTCARTEAAFGE